MALSWPKFFRLPGARLILFRRNRGKEEGDAGCRLRSRVWTWVIGQTRITKYTHPYRFSNPWLSDYPRPT